MPGLHNRLGLELTTPSVAAHCSVKDLEWANGGRYLEGAARRLS